MSIETKAKQLIHEDKMSRRSILAGTAIAGTAVAAGLLSASVGKAEEAHAKGDSGDLKQFADAFGIELFLEADNMDGTTPKSLIWAELWQRGNDKPSKVEIAFWLSSGKEIGTPTKIENVIKIRFHWAHLGHPKFVETPEAPANMCYLIAWISWDKHDRPTADGIVIPC